MNARPLRRAVHAELLKTTTLRTWWVLALIMLGYTAMTAASIAVSFGLGLDPDPNLAWEVDLPTLVYSVATSIGFVFPLIVGVLAVTGELRHKTVTPTFLAAPRRGVSLVAKLAVQGVLGLLYGVVAFAGVIAVGAACLALTGMETGLDSASTWALVGRGMLAMGLWAVVGVGVGTLLRNQVAAVVVVLAFTQFVEPILRMLAMMNSATARVGRFLPGAASDDLVGASIYQVLGTSDPSPWWLGGLVLLGYALVTTWLGYLVTWRRDVT